MLEDREKVPDMDWKKPSLAVIAYNGNAGCVLFSAGPHIESMLSDVGNDLSIFEGEPLIGISIWEGVMTGGKRTWEGDYDDVYLRGPFRRATNAEWDAINRGENPWDPDAWLLPARLYGDG